MDLKLDEIIVFYIVPCILTIVVPIAANSFFNKFEKHSLVHASWKKWEHVLRRSNSINQCINEYFKTEFETSNTWSFLIFMIIFISVYVLNSICLLFSILICSIHSDFWFIQLFENSPESLILLINILIVSVEFLIVLIINIAENDKSRQKMLSKLFLRKKKIVKNDNEIKKSYSLLKSVTLVSSIFLLALSLFLIGWIINFSIYLDTTNQLESIAFGLTIIILFAMIFESYILLKSRYDYGIMVKKYINDRYSSSFPILRISLVNQNVIYGKIENIFDKSNLILINEKKASFSKWDYVITVEEDENITEFSFCSPIVLIAEQSIKSE